MKELFITAVNTIYRKDEDGTFTPDMEFIIGVCEPTYDITNAAGVVKNRQTETLRFTTGADGAKMIVKQLNEWLADHDTEVPS